MSRLPRLAVRNVARNRRRSRVTLAAIVLGVTAVVALRGMQGGFYDVMVQDIVEGRTGALQIHRAGYMDNLEGVPLSLNMPHDDAFVRRILAVPGVKAVSPRVQFGGLVSNGLTQTMVVGRGVDVAREREVCPRSGLSVEGGQPLAPEDRDAAVLGAELAQGLDARPAGSTQPSAAGGPVFHAVTLSATSPEGRANSLTAQVKGLAQSAFAFENKRVLTVPLAFAQELLGLEGRVTEYAVAIDEVRDAGEIAGRLQAALGPDYEVHTWSDVQPFFRDVINIQMFVVGLISFILFVIVLTGIANTMLMSVYERVREIGTLLAIGLRRRQILALFLLEAAFLGVVGGVIGAGVGRALVALIAWRGIPLKVPIASSAALLRPSVDAPFLVVVVIVAALGAVLSAAWPAVKASRMNPVDALRST